MPSRVYPHVCGETPDSRVIAVTAAGLSPRMRGNPGLPRLVLLQFGSIPAHAGKPAGTYSSASLFWVYPRACGETRRVYDRFYFGRGLSPRMRGNPLLTKSDEGYLGSIPAHAGKPSA